MPSLQQFRGADHTTSSAPCRNAASNGVAWFLLGCLVFLYLNRFTLPDTPIYRIGDELIYLENAVKMFDGQTLYRDFFQFTPPGTEFLYFSLFKLVGIHAWVPGVILLLLGMGFAWLSVTITKRFIDGLGVFLPGLLFLTCAYYWWLDGTHHWFSSLFVMAALASLLESRNPARLSAAGALCGLALCFTQLRGAAAALGLSAFLCWECRNKRQSWALLLRNQAYAIGPFLATILAFNAYFAWKAGLRQFLWCTITFGIKYYPAFPANTWRVILLDFPEFHPWSHQLVRVGVFLFLHGLVPLVYLLFFVLYGRLKRSRPLEPWDQLMLVNWIGASLFIGIAPAPDDLRLSSISLPAFIVLVWLLRLWGTKGRRVLRAVWVAALVLAVIEPGSRQIHWRTEFDLPIGRMAFLDPASHEMHRWVLDRVSPPGFLFEEEFPQMNFTLNLRNPAPVPSLTNADYTRPEQVLAVVRALEERRVRFVMVSPWLDRKVMGRDWGDHLEPLRAYLGTHYHAVKTFANSEQVLERNE